MDNTYVKGTVNENEELDNNITVEQLQETTEEPTDSACNVEENETEAGSENGKEKHRLKKVSGKKIAIAAGVGVVLVGAGLLVHKNTAKTAYYVARSIM